MAKYSDTWVLNSIQQHYACYIAKQHTPLHRTNAMEALDCVYSGLHSMGMGHVLHKVGFGVGLGVWVYENKLKLVRGGSISSQNGLRYKLGG